MRKLIFWQDIVSPHIVPLLKRLQEQGSYEVILVVETYMTEWRSNMGWSSNSDINFLIVEINSLKECKDFLYSLPLDTIHVCPGVRSFGRFNFVQSYLRSTNIKFFIMLERIDLRGVRILKLLSYIYLFFRLRKKLLALLLVGYSKKEEKLIEFITRSNVFSFTYFVENSFTFDNHLFNQKFELHEESREFKILYLGQLVRRKRVDLIFEAISKLGNREISVKIVGSGNLLKKLIKDSTKLCASNSISWTGFVPMDSIFDLLQESHCLILPSDFDGFGVVGLEGIIAKRIVICSSGCGVKEFISQYPIGFVFEKGNSDDLSVCINNAILLRDNYKFYLKDIEFFKHILSPESGAKYFSEIIKYSDNMCGMQKPLAPWAR